jgi:predicted AAA+ superfamily ATPase
MEKYLERLVDANIELALKSKGCVVIEGPKWCGKSTTSKRFAKTVVELQKPSTFKAYKLYADTGDKELLAGEQPLMFDEWQKIPDLWDYIRAEVDQLGFRGSFILTGSAKPIEDKGRHSGIGRMKRVVMRPMSLWESQESNGKVSLEELFNGDKANGQDTKSLKDIAKILCRGGWPQAVIEEDENIKLKAAKDYVETLVETDITDIDGIKRNPTRAKAILMAYARNVSASAKLQTLQKDMDANQVNIDARTIESYINAFKKLFVLEDVEAWSPRLRSKATLRTADTRQFVDPSIAATLLDANAEDLMNNLNTFGLLFESLCIRDLRIYAEKLGGKVFNYRDSNGLEADVIVHLNNGKWGAIEVKLGGEEAIESGAKNLLKLKESIDTDKMKAPSFLMILVATGYACTRKDGVLVVPIGCLKN